MLQTVVPLLNAAADTVPECCAALLVIAFVIAFAFAEGRRNSREVFQVVVLWIPRTLAGCALSPDQVVFVSWDSDLGHGRFDFLGHNWVLVADRCILLFWRRLFR